MKKCAKAMTGFLVAIVFFATFPLATQALPVEEPFDWGIEGVVTDTPGLVANILQLTTFDNSDRYQCWGCNPWSSDGKAIVYQSERADAGGEDYDDHEICKINADGTGFARLTNNDRCDSHASFVWPDNNKVVFQRHIADPPDGSHGEIFIMDADGANEINLTQAHDGGVRGEDSCESKPMVSPDGTKVLFRCCADDRKNGGDAQLYVMNINGTNPVLVSGALEACGKHSWGPGSQWVIFKAYDEEFNNSRIYKAKADGTEIVKLSPANVDVPDDWGDDWCQTWPAWSPDGKWISCRTHLDSGFNQSKLSIMDTDGNNSRVIEEQDGDDDGDNYDWVHAQSSWSPDSRWLSYRMTDQDGYYVLCIRNIYDDRFFQLTKEHDEYRHWWSPDPNKGPGSIVFKDEGSDYSRDNGWADDRDDDILVLNLAPWALDNTKGSGRHVFTECASINWDDAAMLLGVNLGDSCGEETPLFIGALYAGNPTPQTVGGTFWDLYCPDPTNVVTVTMTTYFNNYGGSTNYVWYDYDAKAWRTLNPAMYEVGKGSFVVGVITYTAALTITITADTTPGLDQLGGTVFGATTPEETLAALIKKHNEGECFVNAAATNRQGGIYLILLSIGLAILGAGVYRRTRRNKI